MKHVRRRLIIGAVLGLAVGIICAHVLGEHGRDATDQIRFGGTRPGAGATDDPDFLSELGMTRFAEQPVVAYRTKDGELLVGWQFQPKIDPVPLRARDILVLIDTSASQAGGALQAAIRISETVLSHLGPEDRVSIRTVNVKNVDVTRGFLDPAKAKVALRVLGTEVPMGASDLKASLNEGIASFERRAGRQNLILFLGDGLSILNPFRPADLAEVAGKMVKDEIAFYPIPLGTRLDPSTLHGLASNTGGAPIRILGGDGPDAVVRRVLDTISVPVFYPAEVKMSAEVLERFPADRLPPLRADAPSLVLAKIKPTARLSATLRGTVSGRDVSLQVANDVPEAELGNFFLASMYKQWEADRLQPAMIRADRALAFAEQQNKLAHAELVAQGELAISQERYDVAVRLFEQALTVEPGNEETKDLHDLTVQLRDRKITREEVEKDIQKRAARQRRNVIRAPRGVEVAFHQDKPEKFPPAPTPVKGGDKPIASDQSGEEILQEAKRRQAIEDQRASQFVDEAIRQGNETIQRDPDMTAEALKRALDNVRNNFALSERTRLALAGRLERAHRETVIRGATIKQTMEQNREIALRQQAEQAIAAQQASQESRIRERLRVFQTLMSQAREDEAYRQAQAIRQDLINQGSSVPVAVTASYQIAQSAYHLRELTEIKRVREERYLLSHMGVERSAIPFPDEPPVQFPPAATWRRLSDDRLKRYQATPLASGNPETARRTWQKLTSPVSFGGFEDPKTTLREALEHLGDRFDLRFEMFDDDFIDPATGNAIKDFPETPIAEKPIPKQKNVPLLRILRSILTEVNKKHPGVRATYLVREEVVEIVPGKLAAEELVTVSHDVGDLVIPIPNSFNQVAVQQSGSLFGAFGAAGGFGGNTALGGLGGLGGQFGFQGGIGGLGALGGVGGLGALGGVGGLGALGGIGGLGALGGIGGGGLGALGGGALGQGGALGAGGFAGALGAGGAQGGVNLGAGGGVAGVGGGQLGQFGNLGGQFGLQGGDHYPILIATIRIAVGDDANTWGPLDPYTASLIPRQPGEPDPTTESTGRSTLGPYQPALALFVKAPSKIFHRKDRPAPTTGANAPGMGALDRRDRVIVRGENRFDRNAAVAGAGAARNNGEAVAKDTKPTKPAAEVDPKSVWEQALAKGVEDPGMLADCAAFLADNGKWEHVAELLRANLRQGLVVRPWVYQSLAVALTQIKASPEEIERAEVSAADLEPLDARGFLKAAEAMKTLQRPERALAFCRQAALLDPNGAAPYKNALVYADAAKDNSGLAWAAGRLLEREWAKDNDVFHAEAARTLESLAATYAKENRKEDADKLRKALRQHQQRDLEITLIWQDGTTADLDLRIEEPTGTVCSWLNRQTVGGGILHGDRIPVARSTRDRSATESYVAAQAFSGEYKVTVERVWGQPLGNKAQLRIVRFKGTPQQQEEIVTLDVSKKATHTVALENGRRTEAASVPPPTTESPLDVEETTSTRSAIDGLRSLAYPGATTGVVGLQSGSGVLGASRPQMPDRPTARPRTQEPTYQTRVSPFAANTLDVAAQTTISPDRRYVRISVSPLFNTISATRSQPVIRNPLIPGGSNPTP